MLCIIDMQTRFQAAQCPDTVDNIVSEILEARRNKEIIALIQYRHAGDVIPVVRKAVDGYEYLYEVVKTDDDGSTDLIMELGDNLLEEEVKVCGVNTGYCVADTVHGLLSQLPAIEIAVLKDCCYCTEYGCGGWELFKDERIQLR